MHKRASGQARRCPMPLERWDRSPIGGHTRPLTSRPQEGLEMTRATQRIGAPLVLLACMGVDGAFAQERPAGTTGYSRPPAVVPLAVPERPNSRPLTQSGLRFVVDQAASPRISSLQPASATPRNSCGNRVVLGGVLGAGAGLGFGYAWLVKAGGSDSAGAFLRGMTGVGLGLGLLAGLIACAP